MTGNHKMVSSSASIPVRILAGNEVNVVLSNVLDLLTRVGDIRSIDEMKDTGDANWDEKCKCLVRIFS